MLIGCVWPSGSLELDNPPPSAVNNVREKRKYTFHNTNNSHDRSHSTSEKVLSTIASEVYRGSNASLNAMTGTGIITSSNITSNRLNSNAFTPLLAVVNANNQPNGTPLPLEKAGAASGAMSPAFRCNLGNTAIAAAASQAIAATQQVCLKSPKGHFRWLIAICAPNQSFHSLF